MLSTQLTPATVALSAIVVGLIVILTRAWRNPLKGVPGPWYSRFTRLPLKLAIISGRRIYHVDRLHALYGPYVRIAPDEIAVSDVEGFSQIHRIGTDFVKSDWYHALTAHKDKYSLLTMTNPKQHSVRRRMFSRPLSHAALIEHWQGTVKQKTKLAVQRIFQSATADGQTDILQWWTLMALDVVGNLMYGQSLGSLERGTKSEMMQVVMEQIKIGTIAAELPIIRVIAKVFERLPLSRALVPQLFRSGAQMAKYGASGAADVKSSENSRNVFSTIAAEAEKGEQLDEGDLKAEAVTFIVAGVDTTGVTLSYLVWAVLSQPALQVKLEEEAGSLPDDYNASDVEKLTLLDAVIAETLRLYGAAPGGLPRVVPSGGAIMGGIAVPGGTTVTTQAYTYHRNPELFPQPHEFLPSRWLDGQMSPVAKKLFHPLGAGSRVCVGMYLAYMELRLASAEFFRVCKGARLASSTTAKSMEMENHFLVAPRGHKCEIVLPGK